ncbi:hypothetical protein DID88_000542 [Monilinia fructigena]|uniref:6-phosphogluconate dehydrogenase NADP-binding domain-containing protein n=1 Tax=Monilinia fructigena TaxID=38457 RepID=A0A395IHX2_9HELO|nr:hypothetical protein DID88_000542 [Monilinia fructigena]
MSSLEKPGVAFIGLGAMGMGMATNLLRTFSVTGFDVYEPTLEKFRLAGGQTATTPRSAVANAQKDVELVDAPVSGGTARAALGTLVVLASGPEKSLEAAKPVLNAMAEPLHTIPGGLGAGTKAKMVHQALAGIHMIMASEAMGFAAFLGLNTKQAFDYLITSSGRSWMLANRVPHMLENNLHPYSALNILVKDIGIVTADGRRVKCPLFLCSAAEQVLVSGVRSGFGLEDDSGLVRAYIPTQPSLVFEQTTAVTAISGHDPRLKLVEDILAGAIGLDAEMLYDIVKGAAGASTMFVEKVPALLSGKCTSKVTVNNIIARLNLAIEEASQIKYPLHLTATALQILQLASARGFGDEPDVAVAKIWDSQLKFPSPVLS